MKHLRRLWKWILALMIIGVVIWAGSSLFLRQSTITSAQTSYTQEYVVQRGDITASISPIGEVYAPHTVELAFDASNVRLTEINVKVGQTVKAGDILAKIDVATLQGALDKAKANLLSAEDALETAKNPYTDVDKRQAEAAVTQAKTNLVSAQKKLADLLNPDLKAAAQSVQDAQRNLQVARDKLASLKTDKTTQAQIDTLQWQANEAEAYHGQQLSHASGPNPSEKQLDYEWFTRNLMLDAQDALQRAQIQAKVDLMTAEHNVQVAEDNLADAQKKLAELQAGPNPIALAQAKNAVAQAEYDLQKAQDNLKTILAGPNQEKVRLAQARYDAAKASYEEALAAVNSAVMKAPFAGTVVTVNGNVGDLVSSSLTVIILADLTELRVRASIDETQIAQVEVGQPVVITFDALPGKRFRGEVIEVPLEGKLSNNVMTYAVVISMKDAETASLKPGMTANLQITTGSKKGVLLVPTMAVLQNAEGTFVTVKDEATGGTTSVAVQLGLKSGVYAEVVKGLNEGDVVIITYQAAQQQTTGQRQTQQQSGGIFSGLRVAR